MSFRSIPFHVVAVHAEDFRGEGHRGRCGCGSAAHDPTDRTEHHHWPGEDFAGGFGVRRPLRFLAWKLGLEIGRAHV